MVKLEEQDFIKHDFHELVFPEVVAMGEEVYANFGIEFSVLTDEHIKALQEGKCLYFDIEGGEYAFVIRKGQ